LQRFYSAYRISIKVRHSIGDMFCWLRLRACFTAEHGRPNGKCWRRSSLILPSMWCGRCGFGRQIKTAEDTEDAGISWLRVQSCPIFYKLITSMLDLNFVRDNLPLVEEKLRQRGMNPADVLKDFREVDVCRRQAITDAETMKARRNQASEEIAKLKKAGQDASAQMAETKQLREQIQEKERAANQLEVRLHEILAGIPNIPHESVPVGKS